MKQFKSYKSFEGRTDFWAHESKSTKTEMRFSTFTPPGEIKGCLFWLSGLTCTEENFISKAGAQKYLAENHMMVVCPDTSPRGLDLPGEHYSYDFGSGASFYVNATVGEYATHYRMYDYIVNELYEFIQKQFHVKLISISGHSMGGHGALVIGLKNPHKFSSISAFSPIVNPSIAPWGIKAFTGYLGEDKATWNEYDATELLKHGFHHPEKILIHQGTVDEFLETQLHTQNFTEMAVEKAQIGEVVYAEGYDHSYYFISTFIEAHIKHHAAAQERVKNSI